MPIPHDPKLYKRRHYIENSFARLKDWRRVATRHDRCPNVFLSACALAAIVMFWLCILTLLYVGFASLLPSPPLAKGGDGGGVWRLSLVALTTFPSEPASSLFIVSNS